MFDDDSIQHPEQEEEGTYTPQEVIRKDFDLLWQTILQQERAEAYRDVPLAVIADELINARLRLYERAGLLRAPEINSPGSE